ncbi:MAG: hypothetical protein ABR499_03800 [Gemmatimonadaceae bacterium]
MTVVRVRTVLALVALLLPTGLSAQRLPLPGTGRRGPARPAPLPPQPEPIARNLAYKRLRLSVESYPLISYVRSPEFTISDWTSFGTGTRADYRVARHVSVTLDLTSSFVGGPADVHTAELGTRLGSERSERTLYRFVDVRVGYVRSHGSSYFDATWGEYGSPTMPDGGGFHYSSGFGGVGGVGMEYALTRTLSLTTAASAMRNRMTTRTLVGADRGERSYTMTLYRYTLGIRYNPVRVIRVPGTDLR